MNEVANKLPDFSQRDLINAYHDGLREAVDFVQTIVVPVLKGQLNLQDREAAILGIFYRIHSLASSLTRLNKLLDFNAVAIICRTIYELLLDLKLLSSSDSSDADIKRFKVFPRVNRFHAAKKVTEFQKIHPEVVAHAFFNSDIRRIFVLDDERTSSVEAQVHSLWGTNNQGKPNWPDHWSGLKIRDRAKKFGVFYVQEYLEIFGMLSWYVHAGSTSYAGFSLEALEGVYGIAQNMSRKMYIEALVICAKRFALFDAIESFSQVIEFLRDAPREILVKNALDSKSNDEDSA